MFRRVPAGIGPSTSIESAYACTTYFGCFFRVHSGACLRKDTWIRARANLKRVHKDRRARAHLLRLAFLLLVPALCIAYLAWLIGTGAIYFVPFVVPVIWWIQRSHRKQDESSLRIAPGPDNKVPELTEEERAEVRTFFAHQALVLAVFLDRAASEAYLKNNKVPEGREVISR